MRTTLPLLLLLLNTGAMAQCPPDSPIVNGAFTGPEGNDSPPPGWSATNSPDTNDEIGPPNANAYEWTGTPLPSPDGGTWVSLYGPETISQTVTLETGTQYDLCFYYAAQGIMVPNFPSFTFNEPVGVVLRFNGVDVLQTPDDPTQYTWESACHTFIAEDTAMLVTLATTQTNQYVGIDGVCIGEGLTTGYLQLPMEAPLAPYPNPTNGPVQLALPGNGAGRLEVMDTHGRIIMAQNHASGPILLESGELPGGTYLLKWSPAQGAVQRGLLVRE